MFHSSMDKVVASENMSRARQKLMGEFLSSTTRGFLLLVTVLLSPVLYTMFGASSGAAGVFVVAGIYLFILVLRNAAAPMKISISTVLIMFGLFLVVITQGATSFFINNEFEFPRFGQSLLLLFITILGALSFAYLSSNVTGNQADVALRMVFCALLVCGLIGISGYTPLSTEVFWKAVFIFPEPSHYALSFLPFLLYISAISKPMMKICALSSGLLLGVFLESFTLILGVLVVAALVVPRKHFIFVTVCIVALVSALDSDTLLSTVGVDYYLMRVDFSEENQHLSVMAFKQGWEKAYSDLEQSTGLGVGFQQFGIVGDDVGLAEDIAKLNEGAELNRFDGGTVGSKFIGEFGILGVTVLLAYLVRFASSARFLRDVATGRITSFDARHIFFLSCFTMFFVDLFVRGTGYFSPSSFLFASSLAWMAVHRAERALTSSSFIPE